MDQGLIDDIKQCLIEGKITSNTDGLQVEQLEGGISCTVWKTSLPRGSWVFKQALGKLRVEADWFSDIERIHREHEVMEALYKLMPKGTIPKVVCTNYDKHFFLMDYVEASQTWKEDLFKENFVVAVAEQAARVLRNIHEGSMNIPKSEQAKFSDQEYFVQLRINPFHRFLVQKYPELLPSIENLIDELTMRKTCLVHGDFSPKNMLVDKKGNLIILDFEVAHWGNPVFDLAYCIGHLMLKGWYLANPAGALRLIEAFLETYGKKTDPLIPHLGLMLLARIDGKSPVNYITDDNLKNKIRRIAIEWIKKDGSADALENICIALAS
ncbi:MAG TPA: aminoglycoside phosphotransferase family protein [Chitinophagaceae bacterium]